MTIQKFGIEKILGTNRTYSQCIIVLNERKKKRIPAFKNANGDINCSLKKRLQSCNQPLSTRFIFRLQIYKTFNYKLTLST